MLFEPLPSTDVIGNHRWLKRIEAGNRANNSFKVVDYLPRISIDHARRIVANVRKAPSSAPFRDHLIDMIRHGLGVRPSTDRMVQLRAVDIAGDPDKLAALNAYLDEVDASINTMANFMKPWPYLPSAEWVEASIGHEAWPFFPRNKPERTSEVDVPDYAACGVLIYMQEGAGAKTYTLCDSYVLKRKGGVVAVPALFAHHQKVDVADRSRKESLVNAIGEQLAEAKKQHAPADQIMALVSDLARAQRDRMRARYVMRHNIRGSVDLTGIMKSDRKYFALFGVFYFDGHSNQTEILRKAFKVDMFASAESVVFDTPKLEQLKAELEERRPSAELAREYVAKFQRRMESPNPPEKLVTNFNRARKIYKRFDKDSSALQKMLDSPLPDSPLVDLSFYALDVMLPSTFKPTELEWRPIRTPQFAQVAARINGNDKTVNKPRTLKFTEADTGRIW